MATYKKFDMETYDLYDPAKHQIVEWLNSRDFNAGVNDYQFGIDLFAEKDGKRLYVEVEVKNNWSGEDFPYKEVHFSNRKRKYVSEPTDTWFIMLNRERTHMLTISGETFLKANVVLKSTIYSVDEEFVEVPKDICQFYPLTLNN